VIHFLRSIKYEVVGLHPEAKSGGVIAIERCWDRETATVMGAHVLYPEIPADWTEMWAIRMDGMVFGRGAKKGKWEWEPMPSSRSWAFIKRTRFPNAQEAHEFLLGRIK
jgi:hypothetical protein